MKLGGQSYQEGKSDILVKLDRGKYEARDDHDDILGEVSR